MARKLGKRQVKRGGSPSPLRRFGLGFNEMDSKMVFFGGWGLSLFYCVVGGKVCLYSAHSSNAATTSQLEALGTAAGAIGTAAAVSAAAASEA